ncbi:MAG: hypothetical protein KA731_02765 [Candidatus Moranbacteria bacterium]|nr:hypothetical protein [Candidatus Moranbacteria bacterium]MBP6034313.1 hypothetical protein [Candidatus Moranbacteria bacterium]MBP7696002.1 hypothetical protein [Candidatus Moranbacteria bacterium]
MEWIDKVELMCSLVLGAVLIVLLLHFTYSVTLDIRQTEWWERCRDALHEWKADTRWFFKRVTGQVGDDE